MPGDHLPAVPQLPPPGVLRGASAQVLPGAKGRLPDAVQAILQRGAKPGLPEKGQACVLPGAQDPDQRGH